MKIESLLKKVKACKSWGFERLQHRLTCSVCGEPARWRHYGTAGNACDYHYQMVLDMKREWELEAKK